MVFIFRFKGRFIFSVEFNQEVVFLFEGVGYKIFFLLLEDIGKFYFIKFGKCYVWSKRGFILCVRCFWWLVDRRD